MRIRAAKQGNSISIHQQMASVHGEGVTQKALRASDREREREGFILDHVDLIDRSTIEKKTFLKSTIDQSR